MRLISDTEAKTAFATIRSFCAETDCSAIGCPFKREDETCVLTQRDDGITGKYWPENWETESEKEEDYKCETCELEECNGGCDK